MRLRHVGAKLLASTLALLIGSSPVSAATLALQSTNLSTVNLSVVPDISPITSSNGTDLANTAARVALQKTVFPRSALSPIDHPHLPGFGTSATAPSRLPKSVGPLHVVDVTPENHMMLQHAPSSPELAPLDPKAMKPTLRAIKSSASTSLSGESRLLSSHATTLRQTKSVTLSVPNTTGLVPWWTYAQGTIPATGSYGTNIANGNYVFSSTDFSLKHRDIAWHFTRTYNSQSNHNWTNSDGSGASLFGDGWTNAIDQRLASNTAGGISYYDETGARYDFTANGSGGWTAPVGFYGQLVWDGSMGYYLYQKDGGAYHFWNPYAASLPATLAGYAGKLNTIYGRDQNNYLSLNYYWDNGNTSATGKINLINVVAEDSTTAQFYFSDYGKSRELTRVVQPDGQSIAYNYGSTGYSDGTGQNLWRVTKPGNAAYASVSQVYYYIANSSVLNGIQTPRSVITGAAQGSDYAIGYDASNRVQNILTRGVVNFVPSDSTNTLLQPNMPPGYQTDRSLQFSYVSAATAQTSGVTQTQDLDGHQSQYSVDAVGRVNGIQVYTGTTTLSTYVLAFDANNNVTESLDYAGNRSDFQYDANGNLVASAQPQVTTANGTFRPTSLWSYDNKNGSSGVVVAS